VDRHGPSPFVGSRPGRNCRTGRDR
jgi:hypothetical protein